jgi:hypothetical protein
MMLPETAYQLIVTLFSPQIGSLKLMSSIWGLGVAVEYVTMIRWIMIAVYIKCIVVRLIKM